MVYCFPAYMFGVNAEHVGENCVACTTAAHMCPFHCLLARTHVRGKIREKQGINVSMHAYA